ncbi:MAG: YdcF family protein [Deltaproteobacteria bacterium]|nr:YdcF family protein [Deltaproteobacteria bacterium]
MTSLSESWKQTEHHLIRAHESAGSPALDAFSEYLDQDELELAADVLLDLGDERGDLPRPFWRALQLAYESMDLDDKARLCRLRLHGAEPGLVELQPVSMPGEAGGPFHPLYAEHGAGWGSVPRERTGEAEIDAAEMREGERAAERGPAAPARAEGSATGPAGWTPSLPSRQTALRAAVAGMTLSGLGWPVNAWMLASGRARTFARADEVPAREAAIVPGARAYEGGRPSAVLEDRLHAALALLEAGKVGSVLLSGDARAAEGDECAAMRAWLLEHGVAAEKLVVDPLGVRTRSTLERARRVYGLRSAVLCTQAFHLPRALFLARMAGIDAIGLAADRRRYASRYRNQVREFFARQLALLDAWSMERP